MNLSWEVPEISAPKDGPLRLCWYAWNVFTGGPDELSNSDM